MDLLTTALSGVLLGFSILIVVLTILIYDGFRRLGSSIVKARIFMRAEILERSWLALIVSFIIFVFYAVPQAFAIPLPVPMTELLIGVHLALIAYAFYLFYVVVRPERSQLAVSEA